MRQLLCCVALLSLAVTVGARDDKSDDTTKAAKTRKLLKTKISVEFKNTRFEDMMNELKDEVKGLSIRWDSKGGVSSNKTFTYKAKDKAVEEILPTYTKIDAATAAVITLGSFPTTLDETRLQRVADLMLEQGYLKSPLQAKAILPGNLG